MMIWSCISFSQSLKPKIQTIKGETHFCFSIAQSKTLAEELQLRVQGDSLIKYYRKSFYDFEEVMSVQDSTYSYLEQKNKNLNQIITNQKLSLKKIEIDYNSERQKNKKTVFKSKALGLGLIVVSGILILK